MSLWNSCMSFIIVYNACTFIQKVTNHVLFFKKWYTRVKKFVRKTYKHETEPTADIVIGELTTTDSRGTTNSGYFRLINDDKNRTNTTTTLVTDTTCIPLLQDYDDDINFWHDTIEDPANASHMSHTNDNPSQSILLENYYMNKSIVPTLPTSTH